MHELLTQWSSTGIAIAIYVVVSCLHLNQVRSRLRHGGRLGPASRTGGRQGSGWPRDELAAAALFQAGLLTALLALIPPIGYVSSQFIWVRAIQDLLLCFAAPVLIASGIRGHAAGRPAQGKFSRAVANSLFAGPQQPVSDGIALDTAWSRASPVAAAVAFNLSCIVWHVPAFFDAVPANGAARFAEYAVYLGTGIWFWLQIIRPHLGPWQSPLRRLVLLTGTLAAWTVVGMVLVFGWNVIYPAYANSLHHAMTVLDDQQLSGGVLWMGMTPFLVTAGVVLLNAWLNEEDSGSHTDAPAPVRKRAWGWAARSGLR